MQGRIRTRFAPSPTGYMHIGNLRTALYAFLIAKSGNGTFILRIEDTDRERFVEDSCEVIFDTLRDTGLIWDEGPFAGGDYGPYIQSERKQIYAQYAEQLVKKGQAYRCFCSRERLAALKENNANEMYDRHCRGLDPEKAEAMYKEGQPFVVRQKMPKTGTTSYNDLVYGSVTIENSELEDQVLLKSDGLPTYNFANVVDDHLMKITHIVRGNEYLVSTPKYKLLYEAFGWDAPEYIHLPLIMKSPTEKLSKRTGSASFQDLVAEGFLPEAILNYIALLGWSPGNTQELFTLDELVSAFDIAHINKAPSIFDRNKLLWMNGEYLRKKTQQEFHELALPYISQAVTRVIDLNKLSALLQPRVNLLSEIPEMSDFIDVIPEYDTELYINKKMKTDKAVSLDSLKLAADVLSSLDDFSNDSLYSVLSQASASAGSKNSQILWPLRVALTGKASSPGGATEIAELLGKSETLSRVSSAILLLENQKG